MLVLNSFGSAFGMPDASPFVLKTMCLLQMSGAEWKNNPGFDPRKAPYKKLPCLTSEGQTIADSENIRRFLEQRHNVDFDATLDANQRAQSRALIRMAEEHLYFCGLRDRWSNDETWAKMKAIFFSELPPVLGPIIARMVRKTILRDVHGQGLGRIPYDEMVSKASLDIKAIEQILGEQRFLFGDKPSAADASVGSVLAALVCGPTETALKQTVSSRPALVSYVARIQESLLPAGV